MSASVRAPAAALASSVFQFHSRRMRSPSNPAMPVSGGDRQRHGGSWQQVLVDGFARHLVQEQRVADLLREVLGDAVAVGLHDQLVRVVGLGEPAARGVVLGPPPFRH
ncbi:carbohydrate kinase, thermoresistant glucokinase family [Streptomyces azureus]|uniref:Carbohydrate kinase, thermoresistant glucokinase family n=1 Tax=Streptomyces azureus TaxID=146537 RepID=A0A0K8PQB1_STRAJ|nr:carbohydrate kinase, thermoresistant glucokinase family [Streptomyces azureus]